MPRDIQLIVTFYGARGSIPAPGPQTTQYGGNTSCVHIKQNAGQDIILDAGTGIRSLGDVLRQKKNPIFLIFSHSHWDHIQGYPFFQPIYEPDRVIRIYGRPNEAEGMLCSLLNQMDGAHFPIAANQLGSKTECFFENICAELGTHDIQTSKLALNHPGGGFAFRIEEDGKRCAYVTDNELKPPGTITTTYEQWVSWCSGLDVLIHDAQYLDSDLPQKLGWGHSTVGQVQQLALDAEVKHLIIFHHDPNRHDGELNEIQKNVETFFKGKKADIKVTCAWEGLEISV